MEELKLATDKYLPLRDVVFQTLRERKMKTLFCMRRLLNTENIVHKKTKLLNP